MEKKTISYVDMLCRVNDSIIHTLQNCSWAKQFFSEVIKWFNDENATSLCFSQIEIMYGRKIDLKNAELSV